jgi:hypothetical protein
MWPVQKKQSLKVDAPDVRGAGDNASQHSGEESPWGHRNPAMAPEGPAFSQQPAGNAEASDEMLVDGTNGVPSKDLDGHDADKDERRFRSARLQKRAEREGPRLTQVCICPPHLHDPACLTPHLSVDARSSEQEGGTQQVFTEVRVQVQFDDVVQPTNKRRRTAPDRSNAPGSEDVLSGIIGKRVVVPRRSRTALPASQMHPHPASNAQLGRQPPAQAHTQPQQPHAGHQPSILTSNPASHAGKSPAPKDEEQFAVMGLLSLCKASWCCAVGGLQPLAKWVGGCCSSFQVGVFAALCAGILWKTLGQADGGVGE